jgi:predicted DNA-binding antitoxin AbrB/MazE fold protein
MTRTLQAIYEGGVLKLEEPIGLDERTRVRITIELPDDAITAAVGQDDDPSGWQAAEQFIGFIDDAPEGVSLAKDHDRYIYDK